MCGARRRRCVGFRPNFLYFEPRFESVRRAESSNSEVAERVLKVEELESIRLKDYLRMNQAEAAERMGVSQPTFHRIITEAHRKIAEAFVEGKAIRVEGGNYVIAEAKIETPVPPLKMLPGWGGRRRGGGRYPLASFKSQV